jgi:hypothetical protein
MTKPSIAAIIIGIDGWQEYTLPLLRSLNEHEPSCQWVVVDNGSARPYPTSEVAIRTTRLCYSAAINRGKAHLEKIARPADWYIVLSNDVLCTGPFADILASYDGGDLVGPLMKDELGFAYLEGWCVCVPAAAWQPWDERFLGSDYEDVAYSTAARQRGVGLVEDKSLPFVHLDQRQRYHVVDDFAGKNAHNRALFLREYATVTA